MKKIDLVGVDKEIIYEKLDNGLEVYLIPFENKNSYYISYVTRYGSMIREFTPYNKKNKIKIPLGVAHFLEHKMFEQEDGIDPFTFFSKSGTGANASTSYKLTQYMCFGNSNLNENLQFLIEYVNAPYFTDENVEKEKGIIAQEIGMYDDDPSWMIDEELRNCLFKKHTFKDDIAGTVKEINTITKEILYDCYNTFYNPNNMFIAVSGNFDPEEVLKVIKNTASKIVLRPLNKIKIEHIKEDDLVNKKESFITSKNIVIPKIAYGVKIPCSLFKNQDIYITLLYITMYLTLEFGYTSIFREKANNKKILTSFYFERNLIDDHIVIELFGESEKPEELLELVKDTIDNFDLTEEDVERMKKVWIASEVKIADSVESSINNLIDDLIEFNSLKADKVEIIKKLNYKDLVKTIKAIDFSNSSIVMMHKDE